jgi:hypothetical protein
MQHIVPYTPQQNGVVEGKNCSVIPHIIIIYINNNNDDDNNNNNNDNMNIIILLKWSY